MDKTWNARLRDDRCECKGGKRGIRVGGEPVAVGQWRGVSMVNGIGTDVGGEVDGGRACTKHVGGCKLRRARGVSGDGTG